MSIRDKHVYAGTAVGSVQIDNTSRGYGNAKRELVPTINNYPLLYLSTICTFGNTQYSFYNSIVNHSLSSSDAGYMIANVVPLTLVLLLISIALSLLVYFFTPRHGTPSRHHVCLITCRSIFPQ